MPIEEGYAEPRSVTALVRALKADGFKEDPKATTARQEWCDSHETGDGSMSAPSPAYTGTDKIHPYRVLHTLAKGDVHVVIEQNTAFDVFGSTDDESVVRTFAPVAFVTKAGQDFETEERFSAHHATDIEAVLEHADMCVEGVGSRLPSETKYQRIPDADQPQFAR